ncbi:phage tail tape measure protein [Pseudomonas sp. MPFS]|uniref:phage tail tape measure protein n=1 Tax=Pseudomonas sp. MPFS TaxID=2795724 RepID=UPI001F136DEA|nr:phage tail tape measure protein [Pseudomonas sp. MPFS]UMZ13295.1 phage tail tape measure protein [Pseudomonas sp. MPFS]
MATASQGLDLSGLERALDKAQRITDQAMRNMQRRIDEAGKKIAESMTLSSASALDASASAFDDLRKAYDPATTAVDQYLKKQGSLAALLKQNKSAETDYAQTLEQQYQQSVPQVPSTYTERAGISFPQGDAYGRITQDSDDYATRIEDLKSKSDDAKQQVQGDFAQMTELLDGWKTGAVSAFEEYVNKGNDVAGQTKAVFTNAFQKMDEAIVQFATTGKFSFSDFASSVLKDMATLAAKTAASAGLSWMFGLAKTAVSSFFPSAAPAAQSFSLGGATTVFNPQLDVSNVHYAKGGVFSNTVASAPTLAPMALFGEAGPEAIMPLSRGADGSLGVVALGGAPAGSTSNQQVVIQQTINVGEGQGAAQGAGANQQNLANAYASAARQGAAEQIARDLKPGGQIWSVINGR